MRAASDGPCSRIGDGRRRDLEVGQLREQQLDHLRFRRLVHSIDRLPAPARENSATASFARIISSSMSACACGSASSQARSTPPRPSNAKFGSALSTRSAPRAKRARRSSAENVVRQPYVLGELVLLLPLEDALRLAVGESLSTADHRAVEARLAARRDLDGDGQPVDVRAQRAGVVGELVWEHRSDETRNVDRVPALLGAAVERRPGGNEVRDVCDVHPDADTVSLGSHRDRVVEVLRRVRVDGERRPVRAGRCARRSSAAAGRAARSPREGPPPRAAPRARSRSAPPDRPPARRAPVPRPLLTETRSPDVGALKALAVDRDRRPGREIGTSTRKRCPYPGRGPRRSYR